MDFGPALRLLRLAHADRPDDPAIAFHLAMALSRSGQDASARAVLEPVLSRRPSFADEAEAAALLTRLSAR